MQAFIPAIRTFQAFRASRTRFGQQRPDVPDRGDVVRSASLCIALRRCVYLAAFAVALQGTILRAEGRIPFAPRVEAVTVYPDRVLVTRSGKVELSAGKQILVFENASPDLDPASLRGIVEDADVVVQNISTFVERRSTTIDASTREKEQRLKQLEKERSHEKTRLQRILRDQSTVGEYSEYLAKTISDQSVRPDGDPERWNGSLALLAKRRLKNRQEQQEAEERIARLDEEILLAGQGVERARSESLKSVRIVEITVQSNAARKTSVGFSYIMGRASWSVSYGFYMQGDGGVLVEYYGNVRQRTGEDWTDADISLSVATPSLGAERPGLVPSYVGAREAKTKEGYAQTEQATPDEAESAEPEPASPDSGGFAAIEETGRSLVFRIPRKASVPSSERSYRMTIARFSLTPREVSYRLVPGVQRAAHLTAKLANDRPFPLLAGPADSYRSAGFVGRTQIPYTPSGALFLAGFGVDRSIRVRRDVRTMREKAGTFSTGNIFRTTIDVRLANESGKSREIQLFERIPVSEVDSVKIRLRGETTAGYKEEKERSGILKWAITLAPGERRTVTLAFEAEVPSTFPGELYGR